MSVCLETSNVLASSSAVGTSSSPFLEDSTTCSTQSTISTIASQATISTNIIQAPITANAIQPTIEKHELQQPMPPKTVAKLVVTNHPANNCGTVLQKVVNPPLITVLNPSGPLTVVKTLCVTSGTSSGPQFTLVNSSPLNVANAVGKSPTITLLNAPVTVVKAITHSQPVDKSIGEIPSTFASVQQSNVAPNAASAIIENRGHNVFVKNTCPDSTMPDMPQNHKLLTATSFSQTNVSNFSVLIIFILQNVPALLILICLILNYQNNVI